MARTWPANTKRKACAAQSAVRLTVSLFITVAPAIALVIWPQLYAAWWLIPAWVLQAVGLAGLSNGAHEAVHGHLFYHSAVDRQAGRLLHGVLLLNHDVHRQYHLTHHRNTGTDDDTEGVFDFGNLGSSAGYLRRLARWAVPPSPLHILNWSGAASVMRGPGAGYLAKVTRRQALAGSAVPAAESACLTAWLVIDPPLALACALIPLLFFAPVLGYLTALPEHFGLAANEFGQRTRNVFTSLALQYLLWNFNLHAVHHRNPQLHFSLLPDRLKKTPAPAAHGYLRFHADVIRQLTGKKVVPAEVLGVR